MTQSRFSRANQEQRAAAYAAMEPTLRNICRQASIADFLFTDHAANSELDEDGLGPFAVEQLSAMLRRFRECYYEVDFRDLN